LVTKRWHDDATHVPIVDALDVIPDGRACTVDDLVVSSIVILRTRDAALLYKKISCTHDLRVFMALPLYARVLEIL
jgi:hypothetical protein